MNTNSYYEIGCTHSKCDDYAVSGVKNNIAYAIVSDGCTGSNSHRTDVGARLLCLTAQNVIETLIKFKEFPIKTLKDKTSAGFYFKLIEHMVISKLYEIKTLMNLKIDDFDATLLISVLTVVEGIQSGFILGWGDGTFIIKYTDKVHRLITTEYEPNKPYYLSYALHKNGNFYYEEQMKDGKVLFKEDILNIPPNNYFPWFDKQHKVEGKGFYKPIIAAEEGSNIKQIILSTDGISSFQYDPRSDEFFENNEIFPVKNVYKEATDFKILKGPFVEKRMRRMALLNHRKNIVHTDDWAMAAIALD